MNRTLFVYLSVLTTGIVLVGVGCGLGIVPAAIVGIFLIGAGAVGTLFARMH